MWSSLSSWSSGPRLTEARWSGRVGSSLGSPGPSWNQRSVRSWDAHLDEATGRRVNIRNGHGAKTVQTEVGPVRIQVPRDRAGSFTPRIVPKHSRRLDGFKEAIGVAVCQRADHRGDLGPAGGRV
ncbi:transposase [Micromonospora fiedleri]|uniref:transposase n=1 Tax=Micromonospora fiedleri TaxID=1157498 RepID=UPI001EE1817A|nr:transposase [Micromonospora fiedleri]